MYDEVSNTFYDSKEVELVLEHSLVSLSKWESHYKKAFLTKDKKTVKETLDYIRFMTITQNVPDTVYSQLTNAMIKRIEAYIDDPMTATTFTQKPAGSNRETITAELIYYWMIAFQIPFECQRWHLNRLLTLIRVCNIKNQKPQKKPKGELLNQQRLLNEQRRAKLNTKG